ncbi:class I SAM-dependent methyltransferase [Clostridium botulinum]|nr:class I SAM-dependent methyltransferase [Clostridium botulinum]NFO99641.1 class I SAM-dependent methyltransferase [Clostridium botulinum]
MKYTVEKYDKYGYKRLEPIPNEEQLKEFYNNQYYKIKSKSDTGTIDRFAKLKEEDKSKKEELEWLENTEFKDFQYILEKELNKNEKKILLDIGCGTGELLQYMSNTDIECIGIEPSKDASEKAKLKGINVYNCDFIDYYKDNFNKDNKVDIINLNNVLEHVADPVDLINKCKNMLSTNGIIRIKVPNDFNKLQLEVNSNLNKDKWWVSIPDHINYFDFDSLTYLLSSQGFEVLYKTTDFPMELFLLMGKDYLNDSKIGKECHHMRKQFELNISSSIRNDIYRTFANLNLGRNIILYVRLKI